MQRGQPRQIIKQKLFQPPTVKPSIVPIVTPVVSPVQTPRHRVRTSSVSALVQTPKLAPAQVPEQKPIALPAFPSISRGTSRDLTIRYMPRERKKEKPWSWSSFGVFQLRIADPPPLPYVLGKEKGKKKKKG